MALSLGVWIRQARQGRGLSQNQLALRARVAPSTLNRWERELTRPSIPELEQVLTALGASESERAHALRLLAAPRAVVRLEQLQGAASHPSGESRPPLLGDLLRALRWRKRWRVADVACALNVTERTVRGWEASQTLPPVERLHALCLALEAAPDEAAFILGHQLSLETLGEPPPKEEANLIHEQLLCLQERLWHGDTAGMELRMLALEARAWWHVLRCPQHGVLLRRIYVLSCQWYSLHGRMQEAEQYAYRGLRMIQQEPRFPREGAWVIHAIAIATAGAIPYSHDRAVQAVQVLRDWLPQVRPWSECESWFYRGIGAYFSTANLSDEAIEATRYGLEIALRNDNPLERQHARADLAQVLAEAGRPGEALEHLDRMESMLPSAQAGHALLRSRVCEALGDLPEARRQLERAAQIATEHQILHILERIPRRQQRLERAS
ncbi:MAG: helix-turn-helix domain-containing protein [Fimbriimonadales bacterium]|nr:helix-turn-helix domain-containing protein [Fimbriimonadales bacterium]